MTLPLSTLWLKEPDEAGIRDVLKPPFPGKQEVAAAFSELFLLNVFPYASIFLDDLGELNGPSTDRVRELFDRHAFDPPARRDVAADDHLGLCLELAQHLESTGQSEGAKELMGFLLEWAPVCCLAVTREPGVHALYLSLAKATKSWCLERAASAVVQPRSLPTAGPEEEEVHLGHVVQFFLSPSRCGMFLSRAKLGFLARDLGLQLPFASRYEVFRNLWSAAGDAQIVDRLIDALEQECSAHESLLNKDCRSFPAWRAWAQVWLNRLTDCRARLSEMRGMLNHAGE